MNFIPVCDVMFIRTNDVAVHHAHDTIIYYLFSLLCFLASTASHHHASSHPATASTSTDNHGDGTRELSESMVEAHNSTEAVNFTLELCHLSPTSLVQIEFKATKPQCCSVL